VSPASPIAVELGEELSSWFESASVTENQPSQIRLELTLKPGQRQNEKTELRLGFSFRNVHGVVHQGVVVCPIDGLLPMARLVLPNPRRVALQSVHLHLAR
jgi:hypothetical protein